MNEIIAVIIIYVLVILGLSKLVNKLFARFNKHISNYLVIGIVDVFVGLLVLGLALLDILTPGGDLNGFIGQILLIFLEPIALVILILDIVLWLIKKKKSD